MTILFLAIALAAFPCRANAQADADKQAQELLTQQIEQTDLTGIERAIEQLDAASGGTLRETLFPNGFSAALGDALRGGSTLGEGMWEAAKRSFSSIAAQTASFLAVLCASSILCALTSRSIGGVRDEGIVSAAGFACAAFCAVPVLARLTQNVTAAAQMLERLGLWMEALMPVMLGVLTALGATASVHALRPASVAVNAVVQKAAIRVIFPMILCMGAFAVIDALGQKRRFEALTAFLSKLIKWSLGTALTIFAGVLTLRSINSVSYDALGIRTMKFTLGNMPVVGGAVSDSMDAVISCLVLIKNGVGTAGMAAAAALCLIPVAKTAASLLCLRLCGVLSQLLAGEETYRLTNAACEVFRALLNVMIAVLLMFFLTVTLTLAAGNAAFTGG